VLVAKSCGKFVPENVMLSLPSKFNRVSGATDVIVHMTVWTARASAIGTFPSGVVTRGV
jgi:hypothetical protein